MALFQSKTNEQGVITSYHKVGMVSLYDDNSLSFAMKSYVSKEYREACEIPVEENYYFFTCTVEEEESMGIRQLCYKKLKETEEWAEAIDC